MKTWTHGNPAPNHEPVRKRFEMDMQQIQCHLNSTAIPGINVKERILAALWDLQQTRAYILAYGHAVPGFSVQRFLWNIEHINNLLLKCGFHAMSKKKIGEFLHYANEASKELFDPAAGSNEKYFDSEEFERKRMLRLGSS